MSLPGQVPVDDPRYTTRGALYVPTGQGATIWAAGDVYEIKAAATQTNGVLGFIDATVPPGGGPPAHLHIDQDETFYVVSGELEFLDGDHTFVAGPGDFVHVPRGIRHRFKNKGLHAAKMIFLFTPGGPEQTFLDAFPEAVPGQAPEPLTDEQLQHIEQVSRLSNAVILPEL